MATIDFVTDKTNEEVTAGDYIRNTTTKGTLYLVINDTQNKVFLLIDIQTGIISGRVAYTDEVQTTIGLDKVKEILGGNSYSISNELIKMQIQIL